MGALTTAMMSVSRSRKAHNGLVGAFFIQGFLSLSYIPRIPELIDQIHVTFATWGLILGLATLGGMLPLLIANHFINRFGTRPVLQVMFTLVSLTMATYGFVNNGWAFFALAFTQSFTMSFFNVALNSHSVVFQNRIGRIIIGRFHAAWSIGAASAASVSGALATVIPLREYMVLVAGVAAVGLFIASAMLLGPADDGHEQEKKRAKSVGILKTPRYVSLLAFGLFCGVFPELVMMDWSAVFAKNALHLNPSQVGLPYTIFAVSMIAARLSIGRLTRNRHLSRVASKAAIMASMAMALAVFVGPIVAGVNPLLAVGVTAIFWVLAGLGTGPQVPSFFSASGSVPGMSTAQAMSRMSLFNSIIILGAKVLMGALAQGISVQVAFIFPISTYLVASVIASSVAKKGYKPEKVTGFPMTSPIDVIPED
jgi:MFS family permease